MSFLWLKINLKIYNKFPDIKAKINANIVAHLLTYAIIIVGYGLYYDLMTAWKSGKNPSAINDKIIRLRPIKEDELVND